jgi:hypothetical protein
MVILENRRSNNEYLKNKNISILWEEIISMFVIHQSDSAIKHGVITVAPVEVMRTSCRCLIGKENGKYNSEDPG